MIEQRNMVNACLFNIFEQKLRLIRVLMIMFALVTLSGCVTTTTSTYADKANAEEALTRYVDLALEYVKRGQFDRARKHLDRALEIDDEHAPAHGVLGLLYQRDGESKLAEASFKEAIELDKNYTRARTYYGALLFSQSRFVEARKQFVAASEDVGFSSRAQVFTNIALCDVRLGNIEEAISSYEKSLRLDRVNGRALSGITELLLEQRRVDEANRYYTRLIGLVAQQGLKHTPQTLWQGIRIAYSYGNKGQASVFGGMLRDLYPDSSEFAEYQSLVNAGS